MKYLRSLSFVVVIIFASTAGAIVFVSLFPFFDIVGKLLVGLFAVVAGCAAILVIGHVHHHLSMMALKRRHFLIAHEGVVAVVTDGEVRHLSAEVEEARRPLMLPQPVKVSEEKPDQSAQILELYALGMAYRDIASKLGVTKYQVEKTVNEHRDKQAVV
jgi:hypothetical protein